MKKENITILSIISVSLTTVPFIVQNFLNGISYSSVFKKTLHFISSIPYLSSVFDFIYYSKLFQEFLRYQYDIPFVIGILNFILVPFIIYKIFFIKLTKKYKIILSIIIFISFLLTINLLLNYIEFFKNVERPLIDVGT